ncbi:MAG: TonB-dependent receptor [Candidatus Eremiobacteraeota bacterium]|nr:TonB-dependent receptor [Candidatus Eremiobacteraeota bacterium]
MSKKGLLYAVLFALVAFVFQGTWALAGTTGRLSGRVITNEGAPVAGARVTASSPSQTVSTTTGSEGSFSFVSLNPDTYTVTLSKEGYEPTSQQGVTVIADQGATVTLRTNRSVKTIGQVTTRAAAELVRPGTTADVYSVNAASQEKSAAMGGGGGLDQAYSAIASVPGVVVPPGQAGWFQTIHIRGGDFDQVGYELDGVPVLRSYDNYPITNASALGQQELQVYTGAAPASAESAGLAGYINQVIRTGTYPGFGTLDLGVGTPTLYNKVNLEAGGATPNRNFSYYIGLGVVGQAFRQLNNSNGADISNTYGTPIGAAPCPNLDANGVPLPGAVAPANNNFVTCYANSGYSGYGAAPGGYVLGGFQIAGLAQLSDHENVVNMHFGLPHHNDSGKDDIQLLYDTSQLNNYYYNSAADENLSLLAANGLCNNAGAIAQGPCVGSFNYITGHVYTGTVGAALPTNYNALTVPYQFPSEGPASLNFGVIPLNKRDTTTNGQSLIKLQYQKNFGANAFFRIYGFSFYSNWIEHGPNTLWSNYVGCCSVDYFVGSHSGGVSGEFSDQINPKNLVTLQGSLTQNQDYRMNNTTMYTSSRQKIAYLVDSTNPINGICYTPTGTPVNCYDPTVGAATLRQAYTGTVAAAPATCGAGPCEYYVAENGFTGGANFEKPQYGSASLTDQYKPTDKLLLDLGLRYDRFAFKGSNTDVTPAGGINGSARQFWLNATNAAYCVAPTPGSVPSPTAVPGVGCPTGTIPAHLTDLPGFTETYTELMPRFGATYTLNPDNVLRFSYGRYDQAPNSAYQQYNLQQQNLFGYDMRNFYAFGFNTTSHAVGPPTSYNTDLSLEHHFAGSDASFKLTPYLRKTHDQIQNFFLDQKTGFVSGLNVGDQTTSGLEFQFNKGDFNRQGLSGQLSYTYTHAFIKFNRLANGGTALSPINIGIQNYNQFTSFCAANFSDPRCGGLTAAPTNAAPCFLAGAGVPCTTAGAVANPYYNAPAQALFNENDNYVPFSTIPGVFNAAVGSFITPNNAALILNYRRDKLAVTPQFQFFSGSLYGAPLQTSGVDPTSCAALATPATGDPRYNYGAQGGSGYDATTCGGTLPIPNPSTSRFDNLGAFHNPNQFLGHLQLTYDASTRVRLKLNMTNIINTCFGGDKEPWTLNSNKVCGYGLPGYAPLPSVGNVYNPGSTFQPVVQYPYMADYTGNNPFNVFFDVQLKL